MHQFKYHRVQHVSIKIFHLSSEFGSDLQIAHREPLIWSLAGARVFQSMVWIPLQIHWSQALWSGALRICIFNVLTRSSLCTKLKIIVHMKAPSITLLWLCISILCRAFKKIQMPVLHPRPTLTQSSCLSSASDRELQSYTSTRD